LADPPNHLGHSKARQDAQRWTRWIHVYVSMLALVLMLFFGLSGITLNHPGWTFGYHAPTEALTGQLTDRWLAPDGSPDLLRISEFIRSEHHVTGRVEDFGTDATSAYITYRGPGYAADLSFDPSSGAYALTIDQQGWIGILNDLHRGRAVGSSWFWVIDAAGVFLVVLSVAGIGLQLFIKRRRRVALGVGLVGLVVVAVLVMIAVS